MMFTGASPCQASSWYYNTAGCSHNSAVVQDVHVRCCPCLCVPKALRHERTTIEDAIARTLWRVQYNIVPRSRHTS